MVLCCSLDVTEGQFTVMFVHLVSTVMGDSFWDIQVGATPRRPGCKGDLMNEAWFIVGLCAPEL